MSIYKQFLFIISLLLVLLLPACGSPPSTPDTFIVSLVVGYSIVEMPDRTVLQAPPGQCFRQQWVVRDKQQVQTLYDQIQHLPVFVPVPYHSNNDRHETTYLFKSGDTTILRGTEGSNKKRALILSPSPTKSQEYQPLGDDPLIVAITKNYVPYDTVTCPSFG